MYNVYVNIKIKKFSCNYKYTLIWNSHSSLKYKAQVMSI